MPASTSRKSQRGPLLDLPGERELRPAGALPAEPGGSWDGECFADADLSDSDLSGASFTECDFRSVMLDGTRLRGARFVDVRLAMPFAPVLPAARTTWRRASIQTPRWGSAELFDATLESVRIQGGKIDLLNLRGARLTNVLIEDCMITELDLGGFQGDHVAFVDCRIQTVELGRAVCSDVDLSTTELSVVNGVDGLRGVRIEKSQLLSLAPLLADHLGIEIS